MGRDIISRILYLYMKLEKLYDQSLYKVSKIGQGAYGTVYKTCLIGEKNKPENEKQYFVVKKLEKHLFHEGINFSAIREIKILKEIKHDNIIRLLDVIYDQNNLLITYEFMIFDLGKLLDSNNNIILSESIIKEIIRQILLGLSELHKHYVLHRDIKPENILIGNDGLIKIADFGMARYISSYERGMTQNVVTNWYRAPEIFFGSKYYSFNIDIWSIGCIFAQLITKEPLFAGDNDISILKKIFSLIGVPSETTWEGVTHLVNFQNFIKGDIIEIKNKFSFLSTDAIDLLERMLSLNPNDRISVFDALEHPYFHSDPPSAGINGIKELINTIKDKIK